MKDFSAVILAYLLFNFKFKGSYIYNFQRESSIFIVKRHIQTVRNICSLTIQTIRILNLIFVSDRRNEC